MIVSYQYILKNLKEERDLSRTDIGGLDRTGVKSTPLTGDNLHAAKTGNVNLEEDSPTDPASARDI